MLRGASVPLIVAVVTASSAAVAVGLLLAWAVYDHRREASEAGAGTWRRRETPLALGASAEPALDHADTGS